MEEQKNKSESDIIFLTENSSMADIIRALVAKANRKPVKKEV